MPPNAIEPTRGRGVGPCLLVLLAGLLAGFLTAFPATAAVIRVESGELEIFCQAQFWNATTFGATDPAGRKLATRSDLYIRRGRFGVRAPVRPRVQLYLCFAFDNVGKDAFSGSTGSAQAQDNRAFYLWDAFCTLALDSQWANLTLGYFRPQVGRESITSAFKIDSFIKSPTQKYLREHIVGRGTGRETGLNLGGLHLAGGWSVNYNLGLFDTNHEKIAGQAGGGPRWAPLLTGRLALSLGDPELPRYGLGYTSNYFGRRRGVTLALNVTHQGQTSQTFDEQEHYVGGFQSNRSLGGDLLVNLGPLNLALEYERLTRRPSPYAGPKRVQFVLLSDQDPTGEAWHLRAGWNLPLPRGRFLEPVIMFSRFEGNCVAFFPLREQQILDLGLNWYLDRNRWRISLHYVSQDQSPNPALFTPPEQPGDFLGLGLQLVY